MPYIRNPGAAPRPFLQSRRAVGDVLMVAIIGLSSMIPAQADPSKKVVEFAHKYVFVYNDSGASANPPLVVQAPSLKTLIETQTNGILGATRQGLIGGIHLGTKAVTVGAAARQPVRFEYTMEARDQDDVRAVETVRRVFKWAPVMRLAAESDPAAFRTFVRQLERAQITTVTTPRLLIEE
jgi:hypothetical protein